MLKVPISALMRTEEGWSVFLADGRLAKRRLIEIAHRNPLEDEVVRGLREGEKVIVHPSLEIRDGIRVGER